MKELSKGDVIVFDAEVHPISVEVVEILGPGHTEAGYVETRRYKTSMIDGAWKNTTSIVGHDELIDEIARGQCRVEVRQQATRLEVSKEARKLAIRGCKRDLQDAKNELAKATRDIEIAWEKRRRAERQHDEANKARVSLVVKIARIEGELSDFEAWEPTEK